MKTTVDFQARRSFSAPVPAEAAELRKIATGRLRLLWSVLLVILLALITTLISLH